jgi:hypothetical protein
MGTRTDKRGNPPIQHVARLHRYDQDVMGANWRPAVAIAALKSPPSDQQPLPHLPEDGEALEAGFVVNVRTLASGI